jgi:hypothetical protein
VTIKQIDCFQLVVCTIMFTYMTFDSWICEGQRSSPFLSIVYLCNNVYEHQETLMHSLKCWFGWIEVCRNVCLFISQHSHFVFVPLCGFTVAIVFLCVHHSLCNGLLEAPKNLIFIWLFSESAKVGDGCFQGIRYFKTWLNLTFFHCNTFFLWLSKHLEKICCRSVQLKLDNTLDFEYVVKCVHIWTIELLIKAQL